MCDDVNLLAYLASKLYHREYFSELGIVAPTFNPSPEELWQKAHAKLHETLP